MKHRVTTRDLLALATLSLVTLALATFAFAASSSPPTWDGTPTIITDQQTAAPLALNHENNHPTPHRSAADANPAAAQQGAQDALAKAVATELAVANDLLKKLDPFPPPPPAEHKSSAASPAVTRSSPAAALSPSMWMSAAPANTRSPPRS